MSHRMMPPKILIRTAFTSLSDKQNAECILHLLGIGAAADVKEVRRTATGQS